MVVCTHVSSEGLLAAKEQDDFPENPSARGLVG